MLLPDPALSTGYGLDFIARGHGEWGDRPFTDLMAITDAAVARPDIDESRTGMMGGSFGGYMANWIAGHTGRFRAIVSHASLWALDQMFGTTDAPGEWRRQFGTPQSHPERYSANSPHLHAARSSPRCWSSTATRTTGCRSARRCGMWADLAGGPGGQAGAKFLYFPDENHWVLTPGNAAIWYETVLRVPGPARARPALAPPRPALTPRAFPLHLPGSAVHGILVMCPHRDRLGSKVCGVSFAGGVCRFLL